MKKIFLLFVLFCSACVTSVPLYTDSNGATVYDATCNGGLRSLGDCYRKANEDCPNGFEVKDSVSSEWVSSRHLIYVCKMTNTKKSYYNRSNYRY